MSEVKFLPNPDDVSITYVDIWRDGGTVAVTFTDLEGRRFNCCFGGALRTDAGRIFIGAIHSSDEGAQLIDIGCIDQQDILRAIKRHLNQHFTQSELEALLRRDGSGGFKQGTATEITERDHKAWLLLDCVKRTEALTASVQAN